MRQLRQVVWSNLRFFISYISKILYSRPEFISFNVDLFLIPRVFHLSHAWLIINLLAYIYTFDCPSVHYSITLLFLLFISLLRQSTVMRRATRRSAHTLMWAVVEKKQKKKYGSRKRKTLLRNLLSVGLDENHAFQPRAPERFLCRRIYNLHNGRCDWTRWRAWNCSSTIWLWLKSSGEIFFASSTAYEKYANAWRYFPNSHLPLAL